MNPLLHLYPRSWRKRYGQEFAAILASQRPTLALVLDILAGALDARLHPQHHLQPSSSIGEDLMTTAMFKRCAAGGPNASHEERKAAARGTIVASAALALVYLALTKAFHSAAPVQAFGLACFPAVVLVYEQMAYLRSRPPATRTLLVGGMVILLYLSLWGACLLASRI